MHSRNKHKDGYDFEALVVAHPSLNEFVIKNPKGRKTIDFHNPDAVIALNTALLKHDYAMEYYTIPKGYLSPPVPGRADYIHHVADLLADSNKGTIPTGKNIKCLDIGIGANCIYPIIGRSEYEWSFIGSDIDSAALQSAKTIIEKNTLLKGQVECRLQSGPTEVLNDVLKSDEYVDVVICNPPFHKSAEEARAVSVRKQSNLKKQKITKVNRNFGGKGNELWVKGGEKQFITDMIEQSSDSPKSAFWFTTLVSSQSTLRALQHILEDSSAREYKAIPMGQGNKKSRILAWTFLGEKEMRAWARFRWSQRV